MHVLSDWWDIQSKRYTRKMGKISAFIERGNEHFKVFVYPIVNQESGKIIQLIPDDNERFDILISQNNIRGYRREGSCIIVNQSPTLGGPFSLHFNNEVFLRQVLEILQGISGEESDSGQSSDPSDSDSKLTTCSRSSNEPGIKLF